MLVPEPVELLPVVLLMDVPVDCGFAVLVLCAPAGASARAASAMPARRLYFTVMDGSPRGSLRREAVPATRVELSLTTPSRWKGSGAAN